MDKRNCRMGTPWRITWAVREASGDRQAKSNRLQGENMVSSLRFLISVLCFASFSSVCIAQDINKYRDFQFGMTLDSVAKQIQMKEFLAPLWRSAKPASLPAGSFKARPSLS